MPCEPKRLNLFKIIAYPLLVLFVFLLLGVIAFGAYQTAKVIHLTPAEQSEGKKLWNDLQAAQKAWTEYESRIADKYKSKDREWGSGFTISEDFSVIVPKISLSTPSFSIYPIGTINPQLSISGCHSYPCKYPASDGCNTITCTSPGSCTSTLLGCTGVR